MLNDYDYTPVSTARQYCVGAPQVIAVIPSVPDGVPAIRQDVALALRVAFSAFGEYAISEPVYVAPWDCNNRVLRLWGRP